MAKEKKRRKKQVGEEDSPKQTEPSEPIESDEAAPARKVKKRNTEGDDTSKNKSQKSKRSMDERKEPPSATSATSAPSSFVQFSSLQSIFATKDAKEPAFTLFGGDSPTRSPTPAALLSSIPIIQPLPSALPPKDLKLFFPHYDDPTLNARSQFAESDELFFHELTMEEKRRLWMETQYDFTQDWKKKRRAAMKMKRRRDIRRTV